MSYPAATTGVGVAAYVQVTGTNVTNAGGISGQGNGAIPSANHPVAQYSLQLSLSSAGSLSNTCQLTTVIKDVANTTQSQTQSPVYKSYNDPAAGSPSWYRPSRGTAGPETYNDNVASVSSTGLVTAIAKGQAIIEVQYPVFSNTLGDQANSGDPVMMIYAQVIVVVEN
jgi:hypothetical protein